MKKYLVAFVLVGLLINTSKFCYSQGMPKTYSDNTFGKLEYGLFVPENYDTSKKYPLVMFLHGMGNNYTVYLDFYNKNIQQKNPCFVFTPKTPIDWGDWSSWSWDGTDFNSLSAPTQTAIKVLDSLILVYPIDTNRLYVYGISMGGEGVFDLLHKMPNKFAAGISICGGGFAHWANTIAITPFWMFHGRADEINPPEISERVYNKLIEIGATKMRYTNYPGYGHSIWDKAQSEPSFYDWMFAFTKNNTQYAPPKGTIELKGKANDKINIQWNNLRNEHDTANRIWYYNVYNSKGLLKTVEYNVTECSFAPKNNVDTFRVEAVNYWFQKSAMSNPLYYIKGEISTSLPHSNDKKKMKIARNDGSVHVDAPDDGAFPVIVQLLTFDGKVLLKEEYPKPSHIVVDISIFNNRMLILKVMANNHAQSFVLRPR